MRRTAAFLAAGILVLAGGLAWAGSEDRWLHIRVDESGGKGETVRVNVPLTLLESVAPVLEDIKVDGGKLRLGEKEMDAVQLRRILEAVKKAPDAEYVTVESSEDNVVVAKSGDILHIRVIDGASEGRVEVKIPLAVVDALLSAPDGRLNLVAAVRALGQRGTGDLITVSDPSSHVRIWIDDRNVSR